jgi:hypothetical protein
MRTSRLLAAHPAQLHDGTPFSRFGANRPREGHAPDRSPALRFTGDDIKHFVQHTGFSYRAGRTIGMMGGAFLVLIWPMTLNPNRS